MQGDENIGPSAIKRQYSFPVNLSIAYIVPSPLPMKSILPDIAGWLLIGPSVLKENSIPLVANKEFDPLWAVFWQKPLSIKKIKRTKWIILNFLILIKNNGINGNKMIYFFALINKLN